MKIVVCFLALTLAASCFGQTKKDTLLSVGYGYFQKGKFLDALVNYEQAQNLDSLNGDVYYYKALVYMTLHEFPKALANYNHAVALSPNDPDNVADRGVAYVRNGKLDSALLDFKKAIRLDPKNKKRYFNLGNLYKDSDILDSALTYYDKALSIDDKYLFAYIYRGKVKQSKKDNVGAVDDFTKAYDVYLTIKSPPPQLTQTISDLLISKAIILEDLGKRDEACKVYKQSADLGNEAAKGIVKSVCK